MNRKRVIEVAANLFLEKGFVYTSMDELVRVSKVSKSNVYYHFANKEELLDSVIEFWITIYNHALEEVLAQQQFSVEQRVMMFLTHLSQGVQERDFKGSCPFITLAIQCPEQAIQLKERIGMFFAELQSKLSSLISQGMERGEFRKNIQPDEVASLFVTNLEGALFLAETQKDATIITKTAQQFMQLLR